MEWIFTIGLAVVAFGGAILAAFLKGGESGKNKSELEALKQGAKESEAFDERIQSGHASGNDVRSGRVPVDSKLDPNNRANRRKSQ